MEKSKGNSDLPLVAAAVLTWNDTEMTTECLRSVFANDYGNLRVILVDNGSNEPVGEQLKQQFPDVDLVVLPKNRGFTGGANQCLKRGLEIGAEYIQLIGNDAVLAPNAISELVNSMEANSTIGGASPLVLDPGGETVQFYYASLNRDLCMHFHHEHGPRLDSRDWCSRESEFIPFIAVMFRSSALREVGILDESLGTCWEDYDLIVRMADAGWRLLMVTSTTLEHRSGGTTGRFSPYITYYLIRNRLVCLFRHTKISSIARNSPKILKSIFIQIRSNGKNWACQRALLRGIFDFLLGIRGEGNPPVSRKG